VDVGESGSATTDFGGHPARAGVNALDCIHVEVGEGGAAHFGVGDVGRVHGEGGFDAALAVDGELGGEVGCAVGVGHGSGGEEQEGAEVALVEGERADGLAGEFLSTGGCGRLEGCYGEFAAGRKGEERGQSGDGELDGLGEIKGVSGGLDGEAVLTSRQRSEVELAVGGSGSFSLGAVCGESDFGGGDRGSGGIAKDALPGGGGRGLLSGCGAGDWQNGQGNQQEVCEKEGFGLHFGLAFDAVYGT